MLVTWLKNAFYGGRMVAVDTKFSVSAQTLEIWMKDRGANTWGWKLRDGVVTFWVPAIEVEFIKSFLLNRKIYHVVL